MESIKLYIKESYNELLNKVTWPTWSSLQGSTIVVIIASFILALVIFLMDSVSNSLLSFIYKLNA
ncbi:MAG: preprotein translocase subunit SecE [Lewinellaceae bacterium]|nr:preprotein translocase subunit SecE [Lewinellaceae bacterium]